jgi:hypothetical protein
MLSRSSRPGRKGSPAAVAGAVVVAALTAAVWYAWLGWDHEYQIDPVTGIASGPYEAWQVVGCVLTLLALALAAGVLIHPAVPIAVMPLAFTVAWSIDAASQDETGLWGVGAILILFGSLVGSAVVAGLATLLRHWWSRRAAVNGHGSPEP